MNRNILFTMGLVAVAFVLLPPLSRLAQQLFSVHMTQHLLLIAVAAPLLIASHFLDEMLRLPSIRKFTEPAVAWVGFVGVFLFWHWPAAFRWASGYGITQLLENLSILAAALLFWQVALHTKIISYGARALFVMAAAVATDLPGVVMLFAPQPICAMPAENAALWGLTPLQDQQIAGLLMWVPANLVFFAIATWLFARWMSDTSVSPPYSQFHEWEMS